MLWGGGDSEEDTTCAEGSPPREAVHTECGSPVSRILLLWNAKNLEES